MPQRTLSVFYSCYRRKRRRRSDLWLHHPKRRKGDNIAVPLSSLGRLENPRMSIDDTNPQSTPLVTVTSIKPSSTSLKAAPKKKISKRRSSRKSLFKNTVTEDIKNDMSEILPIVLTKLQKVGLLLDFCNFLRLIKTDKFPLHNISMLLFFEVVHWYSLDSTSQMVYSDECMKFWKVFYKLFHGKALQRPSVMSGPVLRKNKP